MSSFALVALTVLLGGCGRAESSKSNQPATIVVSADTAGWITPCGCTANQSGGLLRRASYINGLKEKGPVVYLDAGGAILGDAQYSRIKFEAIIRGEMVMNLTAHNIGRSEAALGAVYLRDVANRLKTPLVSCNVRDADGNLIADPLKIVPIGATRLAIVGALSPGYLTSSLHVDEPRKAILAALDSVKGEYDAVIVLAYMPQDELEPLAAALPEVDAVIGGPTGQPVPAHRVGPVLVTSSTSKGKFLDQIDLTSPGSTRDWQAQIVEMDERFPNDARLVAVLDDYLSELKTLDLTATQSGLATAVPAGAPATYRVAGSSSCTLCHAAESQQYLTTAHSHAWQTLQAKKFDADPSCRSCHTTSYGLPGGFDSFGTTPALVSVGCESCHGPSLAHATDPRVHTPYVAAEACARCHDHENSPKFEFAAYWEKILHGKSAGRAHPAMLPGGD